MNYLIAKKKRTRNTYYLILAETEPIYQIPEDLTNPIEYNPNYRLEEDEWFGISEFSNSNFSVELIKNIFNSAEYSQIENNQYREIKFFCAYESDEYYCFQKFGYQNVIHRRWFNLTGEPVLKTEQPIIIIKEIPDAIYAKSEDILYFKNLADLKGIFPDIDDLYKEATDEETITFLNQSFINLVEEFGVESVKSANRKRINMAVETLDRLTQDQKSEVFEYLKGYCPELNFNEENNTFDISSEESLKRLIFGIEERFYTTLVGNERRLANSILRLQ